MYKKNIPKYSVAKYIFPARAGMNFRCEMFAATTCVMSRCLLPTCMIRNVKLIAILRSYLLEIYKTNVSSAYSDAQSGNFKGHDFKLE